uniref:Retroelement silencing factor 1 n=1 Tax=Otolemur garnettii TaxID=30611 RepID=H0XQJ9_OTOGA
MNWNAEPQSAILPPPYSKSQSSFSQQSLINQFTPSHSTFSYSGNNRETCMYPSNSNTVSQPLLNIQNYLQQIPVSDVHNGTVVASQTSLERLTLSNAKGHKQLNHNLQMSPGVTQNAWSNSPVRNSMPSHTGATVSHHTDFGTNIPSVHALQNQLVTSDTYSTQLQMMPSNSLRAPVTYQGNQGLNQSNSVRNIEGWAQQYTSNGLTSPDYRPLPKQYCYSPQASTSLQVKNSHFPNTATALQSKQSAAVLSQQYATPVDKRLAPPPLPLYDCRYGSQPLQSAPLVLKRLSVEVPQSQETHSSEVRMDSYRGFQQQWQNPLENVSTIGNFCNVKVNANVKQPFLEPVRSSMDAVQPVAQNNQEKRMDSCNPNQILDTNVTKEKLVRDIKTLVEIKKNFTELARKIKISKDLLIAAGCIKMSNTSNSERGNSSCIKHDSSTERMPAKSDSPYSMELLATCLSLWKKKPLETAEDKQCNESRTNKTEVGVSRPMDVSAKRTCSVVGNSPNKIINPSQTTLSVMVPNYESSGTTVTKGTELQVAVVTPLILSDVKTLSVKGIIPEALPETVYPVIKEGSVCSLQNQLAENTTVSAALKDDVNGPVASTVTSTKIHPLTQKEKNESTNGDSEGTPNTNEGKYSKLESDTYSLVSDQQALCKSRDITVVNSDILQIDSICSLVEGDVSYNSQIAKIFNSLPMEKVEPQKPLPSQEGNSYREQKEQLDNTTENKDFDFQKDELIECTDVSHKLSDMSKSQQPPESLSFNAEASRGTLEQSGVAHSMKESTAGNVCSSAATPLDIDPQEIDVSSNYIAQEPTRNEIDSDKTLYLHDQLSELLREFPYGIEGINRCKGSVGLPMTNHISEDQATDKSSCDSKDSTDQIQITILSSEQMKELFPGQDDQPCDRDRSEEPQKEEPNTEVGSQHDPQAPTTGESRDSLSVDSEKDDVHCCALGWLAMVYEGVPQCQCDSIKNSASEEENGKEQSSMETSNGKQGERTSDSDVAIVELIQLNSPSNNPKTSVTLPDRNSTFPEIQSSDTKDTSQTKQNSLLKTEQKSTDHFSSKCDKLVSLQNHGKKNLKYHEVTFNSHHKMITFHEQAQQSLQKKHGTQNSRPLKAKPVLVVNKDHYKKNSSLVQLVASEKKKIKFKAGGFKQNHLEKRKLDQGSILDIEVKKRKQDIQEQNKNVGGALKVHGSSSNPNERASVKDKTVSSTTSSDMKVSSSKVNRVITVQEYFERRKHKEAISDKAAKRILVKNRPHNSEYLRPSKPPMQVGSWGKPNERPSVSLQTPKESLSVFTNPGKNHKVHRSEGSKAYTLSRNVKGTTGGKPADKMWIDKAKLDKKVTHINNEVRFSQMPPQAKEQRKLYLNRVAFKCTERESICLTKLDGSPRKLNKDNEKTQENKPKTLLPVKDTTKKPNMLEFKLCPDVLFKNTSSSEEKKDLKSHPRKEQTPMQVSGIKSTKEDWLKRATVKKRMQEDTQEIDKDVNSRLSKRSFSADGFEMLQNPVKDSKALFQTYKQMHLEKRSRSLGSSPVK